LTKSLEGRRNQGRLNTEANGTAALWVWNTDENGASFTVPSGYVDYVDLTGAQTAISSGSSITISVLPIMLEQ